MGREKRAILRKQRTTPDPWDGGIRSQGDAIAPDYVRLESDHGQIGRTWFTVLHIATLDPETSVGFLQRLVRGKTPVDIAWYLNPVPREQAMSRLTRGASTALAELAAMERQGLVDPMAVRGAQDMEALRHLVDAGEEALWSAGIYILVRGESREALENSVRQVLLTLGHGAHARVAYELQWPGLEAFAPVGREDVELHLLLDTTTVVKSWPLGSASLRRPAGIFWGFDKDTSGLVIFDPFDRTLLRNSNMVVCGPTGAGKSFFVKLMLLRLLQEGVRFTVIDPKGEYRWVCETLGADLAEYIPLSASAQRGVNLFALPRDTPDLEEFRFPVRRKVAALRAQIGQMLGGLTPEQEGVLDAALFDLYREISGLPRDVTQVPEGVQFPRLSDLVRVLEREEAGCAMARALQKYARGGSLGGLYDPEDYLSPETKRLVCFGISSLAREDRPAASLMIADWVTGAVFSQRRSPHILIVDEAWTLLSGPGASVLSDLVRIARSLNAGVWCISQLVEDFVGTRDMPKEQGQAVFENSALRAYLPGAIGNPQALPASVGMTVDLVALLRQASLGEVLLDLDGRWLRLETGQGAHTRTEYMICTSHPGEVDRFREEMRERRR